MKNKLSWILQIVAAVILLQTLYFKFTAQPESVELFTKLGAEPWGRIGTGIIELIAGILLFIPRIKIYGALLSVNLMIGAILSHLLAIGIESQGDGGQLFMLAIIVLVSCSLVCFLNFTECKAILSALLRLKKPSLVLIFGLLILPSCKKKNNTPEIILNEQTDTSYTKIKSGSFMNGPYGTVSGNVEILKKGSQYFVQLKAFNSTNGPALHVYLSKESTPKNYKDLGALKSTSGNQLYSLGGMPDLTQYAFVCVHCVQYDHLFGYSTLN